MARNYHEYEVREVASEKLIETLFISEITETRGWILGQWYKDSETGDLKTKIKSEDGSLVAIYIETHYDSEGGELF